MHVLGGMGVGAQLRRAREARGLTVRDVADATKISSRQIDAIESEHYEKLPGGIFGRGYVRAFAAALKLDADAIVEAYRDETEPERSALPHPTMGEGAAGVAPRAPSPGRVQATWHMDPSEPRLRMAAVDVAPARTPARWVGAVLIGLGAVLLLLWLGRDRGTAPVSDAMPPPAPVASTPQARSVPAESPEPSAAARSGADQPVGTIGEAGVPAAASARTPGRPVDLLVVAERASWLSLSVDGSPVARRMLQPREALHARMRSGATLHTGDAGAVKVSIDGGELQPIGRSGEVRTVELKPPNR